jgi:hypothetical protein
MRERARNTDSGRRWFVGRTRGNSEGTPPPLPPCFYVSAEYKGLATKKHVSADYKGLGDRLFSMRYEKLRASLYLLILKGLWAR